MRSKRRREEEIKTVLGKRNYVILIIGSILTIIGYILMSGEGSTLAAYNPDIFSGIRICIAPLLCLLGYLLNVFVFFTVLVKGGFNLSIEVTD